MSSPSFRGLCVYDSKPNTRDFSHEIQDCLPSGSLLSYIHKPCTFLNDHALVCREILIPTAICAVILSITQLPCHYIPLPLIQKHCTGHQPVLTVVVADALFHSKPGQHCFSCTDPVPVDHIHIPFPEAVVRLVHPFVTVHGNPLSVKVVCPLPLAVYIGSVMPPELLYMVDRIGDIHIPLCRQDGTGDAVSIYAMPFCYAVVLPVLFCIPAVCDMYMAGEQLQVFFYKPWDDLVQYGQCPVLFVHPGLPGFQGLLVFDVLMYTLMALLAQASDISHRITSAL